jgi:hypothetical protein
MSYLRKVEMSYSSNAKMRMVFVGWADGRRTGENATMKDLTPSPSLFARLSLILCHKSRKAHLVEARSLFRFWAVRNLGYAATTVASFIDMTQPGIYAADRGQAMEGR